MPEKLPSSLEDTQTLLGSHADGVSGFVFINSYQRIDAAEHEEVQLALHERRLEIPAARSDCGRRFLIIYFNLDMNGILLQYATAQLVIVGRDILLCFCSPWLVRAEFAFEASTPASLIVPS
jgi:hypothetical protein